MGRVVDGFTGQPMAGVEVVARQGRGLPRALPTTKAVTDANGRFSLDGLLPGLVSLVAAKAGHIGGTYGQSHSRMMGMSFRLSPGEHRVGVLLRLWRAAVLGGTVHRPTGAPAAGVRVTAMRRASIDGLPRFRNDPYPATNAVTDDRGEFRLSDLAPGSYAVAVPGSTVSGAGIGGYQYPTTYYPSAVSPRDAVVIQLDPGDERADLQLTLPAAESDRAGVVVAQLVGAAANTRSRIVELWPGDAPPFAATEVPVVRAAAAPNGRVEFPPVPFGRYLIRVVDFPDPPGGAVLQRNGGYGPQPAGTILPPTPDAPTWWALTDVDVRESRQEQMVTLERGAAIHGRVAFARDSQSLAPRALLSLPVLAMPANRKSLSGYPAARIEEDGTFRTVGLPPGRYSLSVYVADTPPFDVEAIHWAGGEVASGIDLGRTDVFDVTIRLTDRPTEIAGRITASSGEPAGFATAVAFPVDPDHRGGLTRRFGIRPAAAGGEYSLPGLMPGEYFVAATWLHTGDDADTPEFLASLVPSATRVRLGPGQKQTVNLTIKAP